MSRMYLKNLEEVLLIMIPKSKQKEAMHYYLAADFTYKENVSWSAEKKTDVRRQDHIQGKLKQMCWASKPSKMWGTRDVLTLLDIA